MSYCTKCGAQIPEDSSFCPKCGTPVLQGVSDGNGNVNWQQAQNVCQGYQAAANPTAAYDGTNVKGQKTKTVFSNKLIAVLIGLAVIILAIVIIISTRAMSESSTGYSGGLDNQELASMTQDGGVSPDDFKQFATEIAGAKYYRENIYDGLNAEFNQFISTESSTSSDFDGVYGICLLTYADDEEADQQQADADILDHVVEAFYNYRGYGGLNARLVSAVCDETSCLQYYEFDDTAFGSINCSFLITGNSVIGVLMTDEVDTYSMLYNICGEDYLNVDQTYVDQLYENTKYDISSEIGEYYGISVG